MNTQWTEDMIDRAYRMWNDPKLSPKEISIRLGYKSTGALYKQARRLKWPKKGKNVPLKSNYNRLEEHITGSLGGFVRMIDVNDSQCREIIGAPRFGLMCGHPVERGSYCKHHAQINYTESAFKPLVKS